MTMPAPQFSSPVCATSDPEAFFPGDSEWTTENRMALALCQTCEHMAPCLEYALQVKVEGIWGGTTHAERNRMRRRDGIRSVSLASTFNLPRVTPQTAA